MFVLFLDKQLFNVSSLRPRTAWRKGLFFAWINAKVAEKIYESPVQELLHLISGYRVWLKHWSMGAVNQTHAGFCAADCGGRCEETAEIRKSPKRKGRGMPAGLCLVPIPESRPDSTYFSRSTCYHPILPALCLLLHSLLLCPKLLFFSLKQTEFSTGICCWLHLPSVWHSGSTTQFKPAGATWVSIFDGTAISLLNSASVFQAKSQNGPKSHLLAGAVYAVLLAEMVLLSGSLVFMWNPSSRSKHGIIFVS